MCHVSEPSLLTAFTKMSSHVFAADDSVVIISISQSQRAETPETEKYDLKNSLLERIGLYVSLSHFFSPQRPWIRFSALYDSTWIDTILANCGKIIAVCPYSLNTILKCSIWILFTSIWLDCKTTQDNPSMHPDLLSVFVCLWLHYLPSFLLLHHD